MNNEPKAAVPFLAALDAAFEAEINRVSRAQYDSHDICCHFYAKLRQRLIEAAPRVEEAPARIAELEAELELERARLAACGVAALGYFKGCAEGYRSASLDDVLKLRAKFDALSAKQPEQPTEAVSGEPDWRHVANEWADAFWNAVQWLRNLNEGIGTFDQALANITETARHCEAVQRRAHPTAAAPVDPTLRKRFRLWFFRDLNDAQRSLLFSVLGLPAEEATNHGLQGRLLDHTLQLLAQTAPAQPASVDVLVKALKSARAAFRRIRASANEFTDAYDIANAAAKKADAALASAGGKQ